MSSEHKNLSESFIIRVPTLINLKAPKGNVFVGPEAYLELAFQTCEAISNGAPILHHMVKSILQLKDFNLNTSRLSKRILD